MKKFKILTICLLTFAMLITCFNVKVLALTATTKGSITLSNVEPGVKVKAYKLTTVNYEDALDQLNYPPYSWVAGVQTWLNAENNAYKDINDFDSTKVSAEKSAEFYDALANAIREGNCSLEDPIEGTASGSVSFPVATNGSVTLSNLEMGTYLILIEDGYYVYRPVAVNLTPELENGKWALKDGTLDKTIEMKASLPTITKTINDKADEDTTATTKTINYDIMADIPTYPANATSTTYCISDELAEGLEVTGEIKVYGVDAAGKETLLNINDAYTLASTPKSHNDKEAKFTLEFDDYSKIKGYVKIHVDYDAKLKADTTTVLKPTGGNLSTAYLDYSNNPYNKESELQVQKDEVTAYTFGMIVNKINASNKTEFLSGAKFKLSTDKAGNNTIKFVKNADGVYYQDDTSSTYEVEVGSGTDKIGVLELRGLQDGTYYLTETKAPDGYNRKTDAVEVVIEDGEMKEVTIENNANFQLPLTGGMGTVVFTASGILLMGLGIILLVAINRKRKQVK